MPLEYTGVFERTDYVVGAGLECDGARCDENASVIIGSLGMVFCQDCADDAYQTLRIKGSRVVPNKPVGVLGRLFG